ncbi:MAG: AMP-binding enzyme family protein [Hydrocarboniphaga sp.]|uniref:class I adenylate-forming enzyme family protein n=1 Tax=Hydrocarboniphaga sp. TaxID=2033016 RepID=UPI00261024B5|nr:class I adenylate-forming enzyme family protein [Hydrocarboniphaga sp.]MDB5967862.1 AMP-binding enzyme family protein [Hydrocarboniphaga sp.]
MTKHNFEWGMDVAVEAAGPFRFKMYTQRRRHVAEILTDAAKWGSRTYLVQGDRRISFSDHQVYVTRLAALLHARGIGPGDRVMLLAANSAEWVCAFWAVLQVGGVVVSANGWWSQPEVEHAIALSQPALVIADARQKEKLAVSVPVLLVNDIKRSIESDSDLQAPDRPAADENDPAIILFTSGATGAPKGAVLSHRSQVANLQNLLVSSGRLPHTLSDTSPIAKTLLASPLFHIAGIQVVMMFAVIGGCIVMTEGRFDAQQVLVLLEREKITRWAGTPTMLLRVLDQPDLKRFDTSSLQFLSTGGTFISTDLVNRMREAFPSIKGNAAVVYGLSEAGGTLCQLGGPEYAQRPTAAGRPFPTVELRIDHADGEGCGEILARSPTNMTGYLGLPDDHTVDSDGWLHTGDLGRIDDEGYLHVTGRKKEVIIRGGENISAAHVETCLLELREVHEVAVIGLDSPIWGEEVAAAVVFKQGVSLSTEALEAHCRQRLAHFQVPSQWWIRTEPLPSTESGKIRKPALKKEWLDQSGAG